MAGNAWTGLGQGLQDVAQIVMGLYQQKRENEDRALRKRQVEASMETDAVQRALAQKQLGQFDTDVAEKRSKGVLDRVGIEELISNPAYGGDAKTLGINIGERVLPSRSLAAVAPTGAMGGEAVRPSGDYVNGVRLPAALSREIEGDRLKLDTARSSAAAGQLQLQEAQRRQQALQQVLGGPAPQNDFAGRTGLAAAGLNPQQILGEAPEDLDALRKKYSALYGAQYGAMRDVGAFPPREDPTRARQFKGLDSVVDALSMELRALSGQRAFGQAEITRQQRMQQLRNAQAKLMRGLVTDQIDPVAIEEALKMLTTTPAAAVDPLRGAFDDR